MVTLAPDGLEVELDTPADPLAPGQSVVLYDADRLVGGGIVGRHL
jgi:tRNA U34 2-thiouridine synthase MnmA/TrmU